MKLFSNQREEFQLYIEKPITTKNIEVEIIFGSTVPKNPINKQTFLALIDRCKENYQMISEQTSLDIRGEFKQYPSNLRCTVKGIDNIKKYCREDSLEDIEDVEYVQKKYYKDFNNPTKKFQSLKDTNYNVRMNIKTEYPLSKENRMVTKFLTDYQRKSKHYRYKKRFSFLTVDKLFRIDLSVVKETSFRKGKYLFEKTFRKANILKNPENYELEIEYVGWEKEVDIPEIDLLYKHFSDNYISGPGKEVLGNLYDPLNLGIHIYEEEENTFEITSPRYEYDSPRYDEPTIVIDSEQVEKYKSLIGKYVKIKDRYFKENDVSLVLRDSLKEYYERGHYMGMVSTVYEKGGQIEALVVFEPMIATYSQLNVPIRDLYDNLSFSHEKPLIDEEDDEPEGFLPSRIPEKETKQSVLNELVQKVGDILESHVIDLTKLIYNTDTIISYYVKEKVINEYKKLTRQRDYEDFRFIGPQPKTLTLDNLKLNNPRSILEDYAVTEKADGERYELFITNKKGYLINAKMNVIDTNIEFENYSGEWLFDGEYITKDKDNEPIQLYMVFDVYWNGRKTPQPIHTYPFISRDPFDISRSSVIQEFFSNVQMKKYKGSIDIDMKQYEYGYLNRKEYEYVAKKPEFSEDMMGIFKASKKILQKDEEGHYPYRIDGLIYLPVRLSVKGSIEGVQSKYIGGTWESNFKWKPPEENTIDFMVKVKKTMEKSKIVDQVLPYVEISEGGIETFSQYKQLELYVGYDERKDTSINFCMKVLEDKKETEEKATVQRFNFNETVDEKYDLTNIQLKDGKMLCENYEQDEIKDGDFVEMRFNKDAPNSMNWEPLRVRSDKIKPQFFTIAYDVWDTIKNPITTEMIKGNYELEELVKDNENGKYYLTESDALMFESNSLKKLHNYIKSKLIIGVCSSYRRPIQILDLSFGQGGDTQKYLNKQVNCSFLLGVDISSNINDACKRVYFEKTNAKSAFFRADTSKNIQNGECTDIDGISDGERKHSETMINILFGLNKSIPKNYASIQQKYNGIAKGGFDVISSQFSLHYYFESESTFNGFIQNLLDNLKEGGYFIGTCYNGMEVFKHFQKMEKIQRDAWGEEEDDDEEEFTEELFNKFEYKDLLKNTVFSVKKKYTIEDFTYNPSDQRNMFGNKIEVFMDSIGQPIDEYLVNFDFFKDKMKENGFEIYVPKSGGTKTNIFRGDYFENGLGQFSTVIEKLQEIRKTDEIFRKYYSDAYQISGPLEKLSAFNNYFIFKRM